MEIKIDPEFRDIIPALTNAEYEQLEKNLVNEGCRERIITWNNYLIDGHNRYNICTKNDIEFEILEMNHFKDRHAVIDWMIQNQIGKRNLTGGTISYLRGLKLKREKQRKLEEAELLKEESVDLPVENDSVDEVESGEAAAEETPKTPEEKKVEQEKSTLAIIREHEEAIAKDVADMYQISPSTLKKDEKFADAIDTIRENVGRKIQDKILNKELKLNPVEVVSISKMELEDQKELMSGEDEEILERLAEVKREKMVLNQKKALIKLEQKLGSLNALSISGKFVLENDDEQVYLLHIDENDRENLICNFKGTSKVDTYLDGFIAAASMLASSSFETSDTVPGYDIAEMEADPADEVEDDFKAESENESEDVDSEVADSEDEISAEEDDEIEA